MYKNETLRVKCCYTGIVGRIFCGHSMVVETRAMAARPVVLPDTFSGRAGSSGSEMFLPSSTGRMMSSYSG